MQKFYDKFIFEIQIIFFNTSISFVSRIIQLKLMSQMK
jgi:hypothetical protein